MSPAEVPPDEARDAGDNLPSGRDHCPGRPRAGRRSPSRSRRRRAAPDPRRGRGPGRPAGRLAPGAAGSTAPSTWPSCSTTSPSSSFWLEAAALVGAVVVGANPTHRGDELARDLTHTECQLLVTESPHFPLVEGAELAPALGTVTHDNDRVLVLDTEKAQGALAPFAGRAAADVVERSVTPGDPGLPALHVRAPRARRRPACAARAAWPGSAASWPRCTRWSPRTSATCPCPSSTPTR